MDLDERICGAGEDTFDAAFAELSSVYEIMCAAACLVWDLQTNKPDIAKRGSVANLEEIVRRVSERAFE